MRVWSIQPLRVWELLSDQRVLHVDPALCGRCSLSPEAFSWMCQQMSRRISNYHGHLPWWGWQCPKPDIRFYSRRGIHGQQRVRLELEIPDAQVLPSNEMAWIAVLNHIFVSYTDIEGQEWDTALEEQNIDDRQRPLPEPWQSQLAVSWERIFDVSGLRAGGDWSDIVQVTFEEMRLADVIEVRPFTVRSSML